MQKRTEVHSALPDNTRKHILRLPIPTYGKRAAYFGAARRSYPEENDRQYNDANGRQCVEHVCLWSKDATSSPTASPMEAGRTREGTVSVHTYDCNDDLLHCHGWALFRRAAGLTAEECHWPLTLRTTPNMHPSGAMY